MTPMLRTSLAAAVVGALVFAAAPPLAAPGPDPDRRVALAHRHLRQARQAPARGLRALPEGPQREGRAARPQDRVRRLRRPVDAGHRRAALREAHHRGQGRRRDGAVLVAHHRGGGQRHREVQEGDGVAARRHDVDLQEGPAGSTSSWSSRRPRSTSKGSIDIAAKRGLKTVAVVNEDTLFSKAAAAGAVGPRQEEGHAGRLPGGVPEGQHRLLRAARQDQGDEPGRHRRRHVLRRRRGHHAPDEGAERQPEDVRRHGGRRPAGVLRHR